MQALVLGADGLLGSHLVRKLLDRGYKVRVFIQPGSTSPTLKDLDIEFIEGDLLEEGGTLNDAAEGCDVIFHSAAITSWWASKEITFKVNVDGTQRVIDACLKHSVKRLIFVGSASSYQFGTIDNPGTEENPYPDMYKGVPYMDSKYDAMVLVKDAVKNKGLDAVICAPTFMLGDLDWRPSSGELIRQFITNQKPFTLPEGRNFAHVKDVAEGLILAVDKGKSGESYILGGENLTYVDFFTRVANKTGLKPPKMAMPPMLLRLIGTFGSVYASLTGKPVTLNRMVANLTSVGTFYSPEKAIKELGIPQTPVETGIDDAIRSLKEYGHINID